MHMMRTLRRCAVAFLLLAACLVACEDKLDPFVEGGQHQLPDSVSYTEHVKPLLDTYCTGCHASFLQGADRNGAPTGVDVDTYAGAVQWADRSNARIQAGSMPPSGGLSSSDRELFQKWVDQGTPE
jgi:uncharacterized membrane protein